MSITQLLAQLYFFFRLIFVVCYLMIAWDFTKIKPNTKLRLLDHFSICDCQTGLPCHDPVTTITDNFLLYLNNTRKPAERVRALCAPACPHGCRLILTCIERQGGCFCGDYYIHRWVILYIGCCWTYLMGLQSSLVNPPLRPPYVPSPYRSSPQFTDSSTQRI